MEIGTVATMPKQKRNTTPLEKPNTLGSIVHMDIGYGDCVSVGGFRYTILFVDRATSRGYLYGLKSLIQEEIIETFDQLFLDMGMKPHRIYTDFDPKLILGKCGKHLKHHGIQVRASPASRQSQNGLVERRWGVITNMARAFLTDSKMPRKFWFWALRHANYIQNILPVTYKGVKTTPLELSTGHKPDFRTLMPIFSTAYFKHDRDGERHRDGIGEAQSMQGIVIGRSMHCDGLIIYTPITQKFYHTTDFKLDQSNNKSNHFNLRYDGGIFIGLYDHSPDCSISEPYPPGTAVWYNCLSQPTIRGTIVSVPIPTTQSSIPTSDEAGYYDIRLVDGTFIRLAPIEADAYISPVQDHHLKKDTAKVPAWIADEMKVQYLKDGEYHKGFLAYNHSSGWTFSCRKRNGTEVWNEPLPHLLKHHQQYFDDGTLIPGWRKFHRNALHYASHVSAAHLQGEHPRYLAQGVHPSHPDHQIWIQSYSEEYESIRPNFEIMTKSQYLAWLKDHPNQPALPTVCPLTVKTDSMGNPDRAKSRICVMGNFETRQWTPGERYAPVIPAPIVRLLTSLAIRHGTTLKQGDCKNAFTQADLPEDEAYVLTPPPGCPFSPPGTYWRLTKSLYGLSRAAKHWFDLYSSTLQQIGLTQCPNEPCLFHGSICPHRAPLYCAVYVDDFVYFSPDPLVEKEFEKQLSDIIDVKFMGEVEWFLGTRYEWDRDSNGNPRCFCSQDAYVDHVIRQMRLHHANTSDTMTPYRAGLTIDSIPHIDMNEDDQAKLTKKYQQYIGMLNWLAISTRPDISPVLSLLSSYMASPSPGHLDAARYVGRYLKSTSDRGLLFQQKNFDVRGFIHYPTEEIDHSPDLSNSLTGFSDANWGPQDASIHTLKNIRPVSKMETRSLMGYSLFSNDAPIAWGCIKEKKHSLSSCEAEIKSIDACTKEILWLRNILQDFFHDPLPPTMICNDNSGAVAWSNGASNKNMRWINIKENHIRENIQDYDTIRVCHIPGKNNPADLFTKEHKSSETFRALRDLFVTKSPSRK